MNHSALTSRSQVLRRNQNTARFKGWQTGLGPISNTLFVALLVAIVGVMYLTQITKSTSFGYQVDELKRIKAELLEKNEQLEIEAARLQSLDRIENSSVAKQLEDAGSVDFVQ